MRIITIGTAEGVQVRIFRGKTRIEFSHNYKSEQDAILAVALWAGEGYSTETDDDNKEYHNVY
jgi:hypothetical protein